MEHLENPYAAPQAPASATEQGDGPWRNGEWVVVTRWSGLPERCVRCGRPATTRTRRRPETPVDLTAAPAIEFGLCAEHASRPAFRRFALGWLALFVVVEPALLLLRPMVNVGSGAPIAVAVVFVLGMILIGLCRIAANPPPLRVEDVDRPYYWLAGAPPDLLDALPEWSGEGPGVGPWRDGESLILGRRNRWPERCLRCGAPAEGTVRFDEPIPLVQRQRLPACREHRRAHRAAFALKVLFVVPIVVWVALIWATMSPPLRREVDVLTVFLAGGSALILLHVTGGQFTRRMEVAVVRSGDGKSARLGKVDPGVLAELPPWPG